MKVSLQILDENTIDEVLGQAIELLEQTGVDVEDAETAALLTGGGARSGPDGRRLLIPPGLVQQSLRLAPREIQLFDRPGHPSVRPGAGETCFVPGSAALLIHDPASGGPREAVRRDLDRFSQLTDALEVFPLQSTALVPSDVPRPVADLVRLYHALAGSVKPVVTGIFREESLAPMVAMLEAVRGGGESLRRQPLAIFDCCPSPPLQWSRLTVRMLVECARRGIPAEIIPVPLCGATAPVTLHGALVQLTAENLSGLVIAQCAAPGAPVILGGCPMAFDMRHGTAASGAPESVLLNVAAGAIARRLGLPGHGFLALSDSKEPDWQAGFETALGALAAALSGLDVVAGAGMLNFIGCQSLEKLFFDASIASAALRIRRGIDLHPEDGLPVLFGEALGGGGFLGLPHTRTWYRRELPVPGPVVDRCQTASGISALDRSRSAVEKILASPVREPLPPNLDQALQEILNRQLAQAG